jgi:hypothetical protein
MEMKEATYFIIIIFLILSTGAAAEETGQGSSKLSDDEVLKLVKELDEPQLKYSKFYEAKVIKKDKKKLLYIKQEPNLPPPTDKAIIGFLTIVEASRLSIMCVYILRGENFDKIEIEKMYGNKTLIYSIDTSDCKEYNKIDKDKRFKWFADQINAEVIDRK